MRIILTILFLFSVVYGQTPVTQISSTNWKFFYLTLQAEGLGPKLVNQPDTTATPTACGQWFNQGSDVICFQPYYAPNAPDQPNSDWPCLVNFDTRKNFVLTRIMMYMQTNDLAIHADSNSFKIFAGTPYVWADSITEVKEDGVETLGRWIGVDITNPDTFRHFQIRAQKYAPICRQIVFFGRLVDTVSIAPVTFAKRQRPLARIFGTNGTYYDGIGKLSTTQADTNFQKNYRVFRIFGGFRYYLNSVDGFNNGNQGLGTLELSTYLTAATAGVQSYMAFAGLVSLSQVSPAQLADSATYNIFTSNKAIDWDSGAAGRLINGIRDFNNCAFRPSAYNHTAWNYKRFATIMGAYATPMLYFGLGNENDLRFLNSGWYNPVNMAAMESSLIDGHQNSVTYLGQSVGLANSGVKIRPLTVSSANFNANRYTAQLDWNYWNRPDRTLPGANRGDTSTIIDQHFYPTQAGSQGFGASGYGLPPEDPTWNMEGKVLYMQRMADSLGCEWACSEYGYDDTTGCATSTSFVKVPPIAGQSSARTKADWVTRSGLILASGRPFFTQQFWATNRGIAGYDCATFGLSGQIDFDSVVAFVPSLKPNLTYYWFKTADTILNGMYQDTLRKYVVGSDSIYVEKFYGQVNSDSVVYAIWSPTAKNASFAYTLTFDAAGNYVVKQMLDGSSIGTIAATGAGSSVALTVNETPQFVQVLNSDIAPPVADAGANQNITSFSTTLDGSGSTQSGGTITGYLWEIISGTGATLVTPTSVETLITGMSAANGPYTIRLTVTNNEGGTDSDDVTVTTTFLNTSSFKTKYRFFKP